MRVQIPSNFDGAKFGAKYFVDFNPALPDARFWVDADGYLVCPSLESADLSDCVTSDWNDVRIKRDIMLKDCDWTQLLDAALTLDERAAWADYRQALRDIPQTFATPAEVVYPVKPGGA